MIHLSGIELLVPAIVSALVIAVRNFATTLDGPKAYWYVLALNVVGQVVAELTMGDGGVTAASVGNAAMVGVGTGATVSVGLATAGKRVGFGNLVKPKRDRWGSSSAPAQGAAARRRTGTTGRADG